MQFAATQFDAAHYPHHDGDSLRLHGHTYYVEAWREIDPDAPPNVLDWHATLVAAADKFDHTVIDHYNGLAERMLIAIRDLTGAARVRIWRKIRGGEIGCEWP